MQEITVIKMPQSDAIGHKSSFLYLRRFFLFSSKNTFFSHSWAIFSNTQLEDAIIWS